MTPEEMLRALAEEDRELEAPAQMETRLRVAFREKHRERGPRRAWIWIPAAAAIAALLTIAILNWPRHPRAVAKTNGSSKEQVVEGRRESAMVRPDEKVFVLPDEPKHSVEAKLPAHRGRSSQIETREVVTDFFSLVDGAPPISDGAELVRVSLPASAMRDVGLPVREDRMNDRVQADVVVNYGMATAVRFVSYQK